MDYVVGSIAALISGNVTPNRPKLIRRALTPTKHPASPNVTPKSEFVEDRSIFLSPTQQKKKAIVKKSPKRIFENPDLDVTENSECSSPKADKVKKHLQDELEADNMGKSSILSKKSSNKLDKSLQPVSASKKSKINDSHVSNENTSKKKNRKSKSEVSNNSKVEEMDVDQSAAVVATKDSKSPKKKERRKSVVDVDNSEGNQVKEVIETANKPDQTINETVNQGKKKKKKNRNKKNKQTNLESIIVDKENKLTTEENTVTKDTNTETKRPKKKNRKKNKKGKVQVNETQSTKEVEQKAEPHETLSIKEVEKSQTNVSDDETEEMTQEDKSDDENDESDVDNDESDVENDESNDENDESDEEISNIANPNAITEKDTDSEHDSDDEIESENEEVNNEVMKNDDADDSSDDEAKVKTKKGAKKGKKEAAKKTEDKQENKEDGSPEKEVRTEEEIKRTLFVGNVPFSSKCKKEIKKIFAQYGEIETVRIRTVPVKDARDTPKLAIIKSEIHPDRSTVNVYVKFADPDSVERALVENNRVLNHHHLRVSRSGSTGVEHDPDCAVFLGNLPFGIEDETLRAKFEKCGEIESVRIVRDKKTNAGKGFGYVNFASKDGVELALGLSEEDLTIKNRIIRVKRCTRTLSKGPKTGNKSVKPGPNRNFGNNQAPNRNFGNNQGPNRNFGNNQGPNRNFGNNQGPNRNFGNNQGPNRNFGNNQAPNRNFGNNQAPNRNFGNNQGPNRNFGNNQGPNRNFDNNQRNFGNNQNRNQGPNRNFGNNQGPNRNFGNNQGPNKNFGSNQGPKNFGNDQNKFSNQGNEASGASRRIMNKRPHQESGDGPPTKKQNLDQPREKKQKKEFIGITAEKKKKQKFDKSQKKKKAISEIMTK